MATTSERLTEQRNIVDVLATGSTSEEALSLLVEVAHDMRSPLGAISFLADHLRTARSGAVNAAQARQLGLVYSAAFGLSAMVQDLLDAARGTGRLVGTEPVPFSLANVLRRVEQVTAPVAEEKGLQLMVCDVSAERSGRLGYPQALERVLLNLITNSCKHAAAGRVVVEVIAGDLSLVDFCVTDDGPRDSARAHANAPVGAPASHGLGLSICERLLQAMGGRLELVSASDGTQARFTLPLPPA